MSLELTLDGIIVSVVAGVIVAWIIGWLWSNRNKSKCNECVEIKPVKKAKTKSKSK